MAGGPLASKKNVIVVLVLALCVALVSSYSLKKSRIKGLGGDLELSLGNDMFSPHQRAQIASIPSTRVSMVSLTEGSLPLPQGALTTRIWIVDVYYPLKGRALYKRADGVSDPLRADPPKKEYNIVANQSFLDLSGLSLGDEVNIGGVTYRISGTVELLPDMDRAEIDKGPLLIMRWPSYNAKIRQYAPTYQVRYRVNTGEQRADEWEKALRSRLGDIPNLAVIR